MGTVARHMWCAWSYKIEAPPCKEMAIAGQREKSKADYYERASWLHVTSLNQAPSDHVARQKVSKSFTS